MKRLGDMLVWGAPSARLGRCLEAAAKDLHRYYARVPGLRPNVSLESCVLCSLTVADFLGDMGFASAQPRSVILEMMNIKDGQVGRRLTVGHPDNPSPDKGRWNGHMVVLVRDEAQGEAQEKTGQGTEWLIDTTLYPMVRPEWPGLAPMMAMPVVRGERPLAYGRTALATLAAGDRSFAMYWLDDPFNLSWVRGGDAQPERRDKVVKKLGQKVRALGEEAA